MRQHDTVIRCAAILLAAFFSGVVYSQKDVAQSFSGRSTSDSFVVEKHSQFKSGDRAPNILVVLTDDVGFGASSTFGGPIPTPTFDSLAEQGIRYNRFHTTAVCSPTRASLLTGRYPHNVDMGSLPNWPTDYDGYRGVLPASAATVARLLRDGGYSTAMFGKAHFTPEWEMSANGPFDRWPTGLGFDYFYGFLGADMNMFAPVVTENTVMLEPDHSAKDYHFEKDMAERAQKWIATQQAITPDKPFFMYFSTGTAHAPNHAPAEWVAKFRGQFSEGWEAMRRTTFARQKSMGVIPKDAKLTEAPEALPAWDKLTATERALYERYMEAYAASLSFADAQIGKVIDAIEKTGELENTLIIYIQGDNGASQEGRVAGRFFEQSGINAYPEDSNYSFEHIDEIGGPESYPLLPAGFAWALNTPFPMAKRFASHLGGTRNGMVAFWPQAIRQKGEIQSQFLHVSDIAPTLLEVAGVQAPVVVDGVKQQPLDGISMAYSFADPSAPSQRKLQVFEVLENFGLYLDGWLLSSKPAFSFFKPRTTEKILPENRGWELYHLDEDFSQSNNVAQQYPEKLQQMEHLFWIEAARNQILPIHNSFTSREGVPSVAANRLSMVYEDRVEFIPEDAAPHTLGRGFEIEAAVTIPEAGGEGVIVTHGGKFGGYALYMKNGRVYFHYNAVGTAQYTLGLDTALPPGPNKIRVLFRPDDKRRGAGGKLILKAAKQSRSLMMERTLRTWVSHTEGFNIGVDHGTPVTAEYTVESSAFSGEIVRVEYRLKP